MKLESTQILNAKGLIDLKNIFLSAQDLKKYFSQDYIDRSDFPILDNLFSQLYSNEGIISKVSSSIIDENTIDDKASNELQKIRKKIRNLEQDIRSKLNSMIHSSSFSKYIQENVVTIRNDRFVIPIKEEYRNQIKGFIHDISNAGSTLFIEPISIFELNNEINQLKIEEEIEIEKILQNLTSLFYPYIEELKVDFNIIGNLDFIFALKFDLYNSFPRITSYTLLTSGSVNSSGSRLKAISLYKILFFNLNNPSNIISLWSNANFSSVMLSCVYPVVSTTPFLNIFLWG